MGASIVLQFCSACGDAGIDKSIVATDAGTATAACPTCESTYAFSYRPLISLEGAPGVGKSTTVSHLELGEEFAVYDGDLHIDLTNQQLSWASICSLDFRVCMTLHATGKQAVLVGGMYPHDPEDSPEIRYFSSVHRCAIVCDDETLRSRLSSRPEMDDEGIEWVLELNQWYRTNAPAHDITTIESKAGDPEEVADQVQAWLTSVVNQDST